MTPRERVIRAIQFQYPDRFPVFHHVAPGALIRHGEKITKILKKYPSDFYYSGAPRLSPRMFKAKEKRYKKQYIDRWGCIWEERTPGILGRVIKPALENWDNLKRYQFPPPIFSDQKKFEKEKKKIRRLKQKWYTLGAYDDRYGEWNWGAFYFSQRLFLLRGFENLMVDIIEEREELYILADRLVEFLEESIKKCLELGVDGIIFADDWGTQNNLMINPSFWRRFFKPRYQKMFNLIHQHNAHVFFHSDGYIMDIIPDLIEIGVDVINPQFSCMNLEKLSKMTKGKICILTDLDRQYLLPFGTPEEINNYVKKVIHLFGTQKGGVILRGKIESDVPLVNIKAMFFAFEEYGIPKELPTITQ